VATAQGPMGLIAAFMCAGLREIGEPARKAMIVDLADAAQRGRMVGVYYFTRSSSFCKRSPTRTNYAAGHMDVVRSFGVGSKEGGGAPDNAASHATVR
jgi:hypothetical protein